MEEEKVIQVSVQLPAQALQGFTDMVRQLRQLAAELRGGPRAGAEAMENAAFDEERFLTMQEAPAAKSVRTEAGPGAKGPASAARQVRDQVPDPDTAGKEIPSAGEEGDRDGRREETPLHQLTVYDDSEPIPAWFGEGVSYQIFPDRFCRLSLPDPTGMPGGRTLHRSWEEDPEYRPDSRGEIRNRDFFGGSLRGVEEKLPYIKSLGVETLYFCPIFEGPENHRYGAGDYEKIDPMLGTKEDFTRLCQKAHGLGMRVMLDGVFNHTAFVSKYFNGDGSYPGTGAHQSERSPYRDWFYFQRWPDQYASWWGIYSMPTTNKQNPQWLEYITGEKGIIRSWLRAGADGWRLDVADELPDDFIAGIHQAVRAEKPEGIVIGEVWEDAAQPGL